MSRCATFIAVIITITLSGCASGYKGVVRPTPKMSLLAPELNDVSDKTISAHLAANSTITLPTTVAVAKLMTPAYPSRNNSQSFHLTNIRSEEVEGWEDLVQRGMAPPPAPNQIPRPFNDMHLINPLLVGDNVDLKSIRNAAAMLHAPLTLVYVVDDNTDSGTNAVSAAYFTIVGLFIFPGHTVGNYTNCQALLVDTASGAILATASGEAQAESVSTAITTGSVKTHLQNRTRRKAVKDLQQNVSAVLNNLTRYQTLQAGIKNPQSPTTATVTADP